MKAKMRNLAVAVGCIGICTAVAEEVSHLTGGETWSTYDESKAEGDAEQAEDFEAIREVRLPTDLTNPRLHTLTAGLAPLYIRYGGTTTNSVYFQNNDQPRLDKPPQGYR